MARATMVVLLGGNGGGRVGKLSKLRIGKLEQFRGFWALRVVSGCLVPELGVI